MGEPRDGDGGLDLEVRIAKVRRRGKRFTRVELSTGESLLLESLERPYAEGDFYSFSRDFGEGIRPLRAGDNFPEPLWEYLS